MALGIPLNELAWVAAAVLIGGVVTGILAGLFGIGGGAIIVPVLYEVFRVLGVPEEVRMQLCIGTSLAIMIPTIWRSYQAHRTKGGGREDIVKAWRWPAVGGVAAGAVLAAFAPAAVFKVVFALFTLAVGFKMLFGRESWRIANALPRRSSMMSFGFVIGLLSALTGIGAGSMSNMILSLYAVPIHQSVMVAAGVGVPITIAGTIGYAIAGWPYMNMMMLPPLSLGFVSLIGFAIMAPVSSLTATYGARLAHALPRRQLEIAFGIFLWLVAARLAASLVW